MNYKNRGQEIIERLRKQHPTAQNVGVFGGWCKSIDVDTNKNNRDLSVIMTTDDIDLDQEIVDPMGCDFSYIFPPPKAGESESNNKGKIFIDHKYDHAHTIGFFRYVSAFPNSKNVRGYKARIRILEGLTNPTPEDVLSTAKQCGIGASIGFDSMECSPPSSGDPPQWRKAARVHRKWRMIELSLTALPCNAFCGTQDFQIDDSRAASVANVKGLLAPEALTRAFDIRVDRPRVERRFDVAI